MKFIVILLILLAIFSVLFITIKLNKSSKVNIEKYQGPVPIGYDEQYFRETGKTIQLNKGVLE